jgi:hypothetical protein
MSITIDNITYHSIPEISKRVGLSKQQIYKNREKYKHKKKTLREYYFIEDEVIKALITDVK